MRLQTKLIVLICSLLFFVLSVVGAIVQYVLLTMMEETTGKRALSVAETVAGLPELRDAFNRPEPSAVIQPLAEEIRLRTGAEYIVVGNREGIRYAHPLPDRIGKEMVGGDNGPVLEGHSIISKAEGSLGPAIRGKVPVLSKQGDVIGIVSVGFLLEDIERWDDIYQDKVMLIGIFALLLGMGGAVLIARGVRRSIHGLEPEQIGLLYTEKKAVLQSIREAILAVNREGRITMANQETLNILDLPDDTDLIGRPIVEYVPSTKLLEVMQSGQAHFDEVMLIGEQEVVANRVPIMGRQGEVIGAVASFRSKSELFRLAEELSQVKRFAEALRAQTHEYSNKLYVISGLIQLESYQEAVEMISRETDVHQNLVQFIMREIPDPVIGGLIIGKHSHAQERKIRFEIDPESTFRDVPAWIDRDLLVTIIGNLCDNAMEALLESPQTGEKRVTLFLTDLGEDLIIECEDNGPGIAKDYAERMFEKGVSSKAGEHRGIGLSLVKHAVEKLNGHILHEPSTLGGTVFSVSIPKQKADVGEE
ncbi:ATP-binding protein [Paenibacillus allorhizosphaerae]|uniref:Sensor protein CitS n=1 Tax=Paenibacillus allorhizosphaerae TaxID=2849866 RepID=A0ABN7TEK3_9BACL|nr:sensor histidine kinase [Paenibacillus allorhizosphaerae]CAG7628399.1 Sensor protein CitS [Paenibacillus allorhizosphaerae]